MSCLEKGCFCPELVNSMSSSAQRRRQTLLTPLGAFTGPYRFESRTAGGVSWGLPFHLTQTVVRIALKMRKTWRVSSKTGAGGNHRSRTLHLSGKTLNALGDCHTLALQASHAMSQGLAFPSVRPPRQVVPYLRPSPELALGSDHML